MSAGCTRTECRLDEATADLLKAAAENNAAAANSAEAAARIAEGGVPNSVLCPGVPAVTISNATTPAA